MNKKNAMKYDLTIFDQLGEPSRWIRTNFPRLSLLAFCKPESEEIEGIEYFSGEIGEFIVDTAEAKAKFFSDAPSTLVVLGGKRLRQVSLAISEMRHVLEDRLHQTAIVSRMGRA